MPMIRIYDSTSESYISVEKHITMPCGNIAEFDFESSYPSYRCMSCFAVPGSAGMPKHCAELYKDQNNTNNIGK